MRRFMIEKIPVVPEEMIQVPCGKMLFASFVGSVAYVWLQVHEGDDRTMGLLVLPDGGPYKFEDSPDFYDAEHAASFAKMGTFKKDTVIAAFHVFIWPPKAAMPVLLDATGVH